MNRLFSELKALFCACSAIKIFSNNCSSCHLQNFLYTVFHLPYRSGRSRHGAPLRAIHKIPFHTVRASYEGRPIVCLVRFGKERFHSIPFFICSLISSACRCHFYHPRRLYMKFYMIPFSTRPSFSIEVDS